MIGSGAIELDSRKRRWLFRGLMALPVVCILLLGISSVAAPVYSSISAIRELSGPELAKRDSVRFEAVVFGIIKRTGRLMVQEDGQGLIMIPPPKISLPPVGAKIAVEGATEPQGTTMVKATRITILDEVFGQPNPVPLEISAALSINPLTGAFSEISGLIVNVRTNSRDARPFLRNRLSITLKRDGRTLSMVAPTPDKNAPARMNLARVRARGQLVEVKISPDVDPERFLWVSQWKEVQIEQEGPSDPYAISTYPIMQIVNKDLAPGDRPVRARGRIQERKGANLVVVGFNHNNRPPRYLARHEDGLEFQSGEVVDLLGFPGEAEDGSLFEITDARQLGLPRGVTDADLPKNSLAEYLPAYLKRDGINSLTPEQVADGWPVRLAGIVSYRDEAKGFFYLQLGQGEGIRVNWQGTNAMPALLQRGRLKGHTVPGVRTPWIETSDFTVTQEQVPLNPRTVGSPGFVAGRYTGSAVRMYGVVRSVDRGEEGMATLRVAWQGNLYRARVKLADTPLMRRLVDAKVTLRGIAEAEPGSHSAFPREMLLMQSPANIEIREYGSPNPFTRKSGLIAWTLAKAWQDGDIQRVKHSGIITWADEGMCFLSDGEHGIELRSQFPPDIRPGDSVDVIGFPERDRITVRLADVSFRKLGREQLPDAEVVNAAEVFEQRLSGRRIRVRGEIVSHSANQAGRMELKGNGLVFTAIAPEDVPKAELARWLPGSTVELTGVCQYVGAEGYQETYAPESFRVYLNDANSVSVISKPSWWSEERSIAVAGGLALLFLAAGGWAAFLRGRVKQSHSEFLASFRANPMPAWIVRAKDFRCVEVNAEFERMFAWSRNELADGRQKGASLWASDGECQQFLECVGRNPSVRAVEARLLSRDGQIRNALLSTEPVSNLGEPCILIIAYDVTEKLKMLAELQQAQKMEAVGQLAAGIAHDFNNLLTVISGNLGLVQMKEELDDYTLTLVGEVQHAATRASDLTGQLLAYSRKSVMERKRLPLNSVVTEAVKLLSRTLEETIKVRCRRAEEDVTVIGDFGMLSQVLLNLGVNARDAMPNGGEITLATRRVRYDRDSVPDTPDALPGEFGVIEFADNGEGMSLETRGKVFEPFFTTKDVGKGTGLGLSTAYGILRQHGGWIDLESEPGVGTTFSIHLPVAPDSSSDPIAEETLEQPRRGEETILVIEDEASVRDVVSRTLSSFGYKVLEAEDGPAAKTVWADHGSRVDLVLSDLVMPNGMSGFDIARELRNQRAELKVIYMSGHSSELLELGGSLIPGVDFLAKPFQPSDLVRLVRSRLDAN